MNSCPSTLLRWSAVGCVGLVALCLEPAQAQAQAQAADVGTGPQSAAVPPGSHTDSAAAQTPNATAAKAEAKAKDRATTPADFVPIDALGEPGLAVVYPGAYDSILQDKGGWRTDLAKHGISLVVRNTTILAYDVLQNNRPAKPQAYNGQKFTLQASTSYFTAVAGLDTLGLDNAKIIFSGTYYKTSWAPSGPTKLGIRGLAYYQTFANKAVEIKAGYETNYLDFIGVLTGGSPLLTTGLSSLVPVQVGLSADPAAAPTFNLTLNAKNGYYFKGGVQRSASPRGQIYEVRHNGFGLDFGAKQAAALYIGEFGLRRQAADGTRQIWLRTGILYNTSDYARFKDGRYDSNWSVFALGDYQLVQVDPKAPYRGVFVGASAFYAAPDVDVYTQYYEGRVYTVGLFDSRPADSITLNVNYSKFSPAARKAQLLQQVDTPRNQFQVSTSYSAHVASGIYVSPSMAYVHNPSFAGRYRDALNVGLNLFTQF